MSKNVLIIVKAGVLVIMMRQQWNNVRVCRSWSRRISRRASNPYDSWLRPEIKRSIN